MQEDQEQDLLKGAAALEHLTGPYRGTLTWLSASALDVSMEANRFLRISETEPGKQPEDLTAHLQRTKDTYEIRAMEDQPLWVNGARVTAQKLKPRDMIEFGETGPLTRFCVYRDNSPAKKKVWEILKDGIGYLRVSRQPTARRILRALRELFISLMRDTTLLFRIIIIFAILGLASVTYNQYLLNIDLRQKIERDTIRLDSYSGALARAREEALTAGDLRVLRQELGYRLSENAERLSALEHRSQAIARVIAQSRSSIVFLQGAYGFQEISSGRLLRHIVNEQGNWLVSPRGQPLLTLHGTGPVSEQRFTGTGFAVGNGEVLVTNRHVALPWESNPNVKQLADKGIEPVMIKFLFYTPGRELAGTVELLRVSEESDLAILRRKNTDPPLPGLELAAALPAAGDEVIVMGYPTGLRSMLAQSGETFVDELIETEDTGFWSVAARLAEQKHISPLSSHGIVSQVTAVTIVYDAETTLGGSGGPVLDVNGAVVAISSAILPEYGGSNLGVPVAKLRQLLEDAGL